MTLCYLCGSPLIRGRNWTRDHIPPTCIFPREKPRNLITVPCCLACNQQFKQLDQKMRNHIGVLAGDRSPEVAKTAEDDILRSFKLSMEFLSQTKPHPALQDDQGRPRALFFFNESELTEWIGRIVKGLVYHRTGRILPRDIPLRVKSLPEIVPQPSASFPMEDGLQFRPHFVYGEVRGQDTDTWILVFYDHLVFAATLPPDAAS